MAVIALGILVLLGWTFWQNARAAMRFDSSKESNVPIDGVYSFDGGEWQPIDNEKPIRNHFRKAIFKGKPIETASADRIMYMMSKNVWYTIRNANGEIILSYEPTSDDSVSETPTYTFEYLTGTPLAGVKLALFFFTLLFERRYLHGVSFFEGGIRFPKLFVFIISSAGV